ncbi:OTU domain-containing protein 4 [Biomphalaria pfeifferi]|uniref:OTU domain-containing protein 4 n=1 Tax=Biomphalaria pfeifferi TaxID=112525 RepID=A0AAD8F5A5_BIOPF|nr:OTU domain-containing protein 4 [Biomphalaria pfeifferi]
MLGGERTQLLGGEGKVVEIDEATFRRSTTNKGHFLKVLPAVFGGIWRDTTKCFVIPVKDRTKETLLQIIKERILPGTTIMSDCWRSYNCLNSEGYRHLTVNHSYNFVNPETKAHTQHIERLWREVRPISTDYDPKAAQETTLSETEPVGITETMSSTIITTHTQVAPILTAKESMSMSQITTITKRPDMTPSLEITSIPHNIIAHNISTTGKGND